MSSNSLSDVLAESYLSAGSMSYVDGLYEDYLIDPDSVSDDWRDMFDGLNKSTQTLEKEVSHRAIRDYFLTNAGKKKVIVASDKNQAADVANLINAYRTHGHQAANLDPLQMLKRHPVPSFELAYHGLSEADLARKFTPPASMSLNEMTLADIIKSLQAIYCGSIGIEYKHIANTEETEWFEQKLEGVSRHSRMSSEKQVQILSDLIAADGFERYLHTRYVGQKRFSLEGGDALIPLMKELIRDGAHHGVKEVVIGMAHRGRLNVLINVLGKEPDELFREFEGKIRLERTGDVKYHLGFSSDIQVDSDNVVHVALAFNPSHLEIISPVVEGSVRSRLRRRNDLVAKNTVLPVIIHGDAAFAGQGVVMETFNFSQARGYCTGGTVHIVINNQIGFTTSNPLDARSTLYCTDVAKMVQAPILHVNGDDPEAVVFVTELALEFRMLFKRDIVIDLVCYRRNGHNEADEPSVTQPMMYHKIKTMLPLRELYANQLIQKNLITKEDVDLMNSRYRDSLDSGKSTLNIVHGNYTGKITNDWTPYINAQWTDAVDTSVKQSTLLELSERLLAIPDEFELHPVVKRLLADRDKMAKSDMPMNWGYAETMAYATLLQEGYEVRLSGQDCGRGTFAHRHAVLHDVNNGRILTPLETVASNPHKPFTVIDSVLSEEAVLAFEYGYSTSEPTALVLWEAQFGDFANGAQVVIDQFISSGEQKWGRLCGLVMLLPHGYEGQGPEHSSARLERYMQLCAQHNIQVCTPTTPAQIFHLLRRQVLRNFRKPLIVMTPKSLLRHKLAVSTLDELSNGEFKAVIGEHETLNPADVTKVVLCCGKVYYDLLQARTERNLKHVVLIRIEQLYPFPDELLKASLAPYSTVEEIVWCQEEPLNQGVWFSSMHHIQACLDDHQRLSYAGRGFAAAPSVGSVYLHAEQQQALIDEALK